MAWWQWALPVLTIVGAVIGFSIGRLSNDGVKRSIRLDQELQEARAELERYRNRVVEHFSTTADLVNRMTADYRAVYEHLAKGAQQLAGNQVPRLEAIASSPPEPPLGMPAGGIADGLHEEIDEATDDVRRRASKGTTSHEPHERKNEGWHDDVAPGTEVPEYARDERYR